MWQGWSLADVGPEMARRPEAELEVFREVKAQLGLGIEVIDIKDNDVETPDGVARRMERAARRLGSERFVFVHPDRGLWMLPRSVADARMRALDAGRELFDYGGAGYRSGRGLADWYAAKRHAVIDIDAYHFGPRAPRELGGLPLNVPVHGPRMTSVQKCV
jgi:hypothetical protein